MNQNKRGADNSFDKEFSLDNKKRTRSGGGKIPPWAWIILAAAVIAAVVIVNKPAGNDVNTPSAQSASLNAEPAGLTGSASAVYGDPQVSEAEMEAFLTSAQRPVAKSADGAPVFMVEETPFAMRLVPEDAVPTSESTAEPTEARQTLVINGKTYVIQIQEAAAEDESPADADSGTIDLDGQSMEIGLDPVSEGDVSAADTVVINGQAFRLIVTPAAAEAAPTAETDALSENSVEVTPDDEPFAADSAANEPTVEALATEAPQQGNWFVRMFNTVFGANASTPVPTATPGVTVIPQEGASAADSAETAEPVRLDGGDDELAAKTITLVDKGDLDEAPLYDVDHEADAVPTPTRTVDPGMIGPVMLATKAPTAVPTGTPLPAVQIEARPTKIAVTVTAELPHTGGAEDWNIPLMLAALAVLVLIVIAARRLRSSMK